MKRILLIATVYRVGERIYSNIPELNKVGTLDLLTINQMSPACQWYGDDDPRTTFHNSYNQYFETIYDAGMNSTDANPSPVLLNIDVSKYDLIIYDDNRNRHGISNLYNKAKVHNIPVIGCVHGAGLAGMEGMDSAYDYLCVFGEKDYKHHNKHKNIIKTGIPSNDKLKLYERTNEYILVIVNYLGNRGCPYNIQVDNRFISQTGLKELQNEFGKKVLFKLKSRQDHPYPQSDKEYLQNIIGNSLDYEIIMDGDNDKIIAGAFIVISAPSTLALKSIQLGIPTIMIKGAGLADIHLSDFKGLVDLDTQIIFDEIERQYNNGKDKDFIMNTVAGGIDFNSTDYFIKAVKEKIQ